MERQKLEKERKQREFKKKSNDYEFEDFEDDFVDSEALGDKKSNLFSVKGVLVLAIVGFLFYSFVIKSKSADHLKDE